MRNIIIGIFLLLISTLFGQIRNINLEDNQDKMKITENNYNSLKIDISFNKIQTLKVETSRGTFNELFIPEAYSIGKVGHPQLPAYKKLIEIPFGAELDFSYRSNKIERIKLEDLGITNPLFPTQPSISKSMDESEIEFEFAQTAYEKNSFDNHELATVEILGIMRGVRIARLTVAPIYYNPTQAEIKIHNDLEIEINFKNADIAKQTKIRENTYSPYFEPVYEKMFNRDSNRHDYPNHPDLTKYPVKYLIVSDPMFESTLSPFIQWKTKKGFEVITGYTDEIGSSVDDIKAWIESLYNSGTSQDPAPTFVLFVGDVAQIPASDTGSSSGKVTDLYYCSLDGDMFPEMYWGRFSATSVSELEPIIDKTLYYEQYQFSDPSYLDNVTLIAGADGTWNPNVGQATIQYGTENYFNTAHGFYDVNDYLTSYSGCYDTIEDGIGFINYTAHGSQTSWADPSLSVSDVHNLNNVNQPVLAIGNCCITGDFSVGECFGESWTRADNGGIGYIGSAPSTYWFEDFYWSVGAFPISGNNNGYVPSYEETTWGAYDAPFHSDYVCNDALKFIGNLSVTEVDVQGYPQHSSPLYYWQAYSVFGDPSIVTYLTQGAENSVTFEDILPLGNSSFTINASPGSYAAISANGVLHGAALVDETGSVEVPITPFTESGEAEIVVTKPQYQPVITTVDVLPLSGPYISIESTVVSAGDDDVIEYGETVYLDVTLKNVGTETANNVNMAISESDAYITCSDDYESFGNLDAGETVTKTSAFVWDVADDVPDGHQIVFNTDITSDSDSWSPVMDFTAFRPHLEISQITVNDGENNRLDPGETADLIITLTNNGGADANMINAILSSTDNHLTINSSSDSITELLAAASSNLSFNISVSSTAPTGHSAGFSLAISAQNNYVNTETFSQTIGLNLEDFETGDFSSYAWTDAGDADWQIDSSESSEGNYSVKTGSITDDQTSELILTANVSVSGEISFYRKVSSESGYDFLKFYIDGTEKGSWSGTVDWSEVSYDVAAGERTFKWVYSKDGSVSSSDDCAWIDYIVFPAFGVPAPEIDTTPNSLAFGEVPINGSAILPLTITNNGNAVLSGSITIPNAFSVQAQTRKGEILRDKNSLSFNISENSSQIYDVTFSPTAETNYAGNIVITSNDPEQNSIDIPISGTGVTPPEATVTPLAFDVSLPQNGTTTKDLSITNTGGSDLDYSADFTYDLRNRNEILNETFDSFPPSGWTTSGGSNWEGNNSNEAGGTAPEARYNWSPSTTATQRLISPIIDTSDLTMNTLTFRHSVNHYENDYTLSIQTTSDGVSWNTVTTFPSEDIPATQVEIAITTPDIGSENFQFAFVFDGNSFNIDYWYIDDVIFSGEYGPSYNWLSLNGASAVEGIINPGNTELVTVGFNAAGLTAGIYLAEIHLTTNDPQNNYLTLPVSLNIESSADSINLQITMDGNNVILNWDGVEGAASYNVYSSDYPNTGFELDTGGTFSGTTWTKAISEGSLHKFYYLKAVVGSGRKEKNYK